MEEWFGWAGTILRVDLSQGKIAKQPLTKELAYGYIGQSGINAKILYDEVKHNTDPFSPENRIIFGTGPLGGTTAPCSGRWTVTSKSPLTGGFGDANSGGHWGPELKFAGYDNIVIHGRSDKPVYLWIDDNSVEIRDASNVWGKDNWETDRIIKEEIGDNHVQIATIGQAGENKVRYSCVICNLARAAGRTGMGAVMGSKNLKAIAVRGTKGISVNNIDAFEKAVEEANADILKDPLFETAHVFGTTAITMLAQMLGFLATRNWQESVFEQIDNISGETLLEKHVVRHKGCFNCPVSCSRYYLVSEGTYAGTHGEGPEYENIAAFGPRCGNGDLPSILKMNNMANMYGLDSISAGNAMAWAMECYQKGIFTQEDTDGLDLTWGNHASMVQLIEKITKREGFGDLLADGAYRASVKVGKGSEAFIVQSKGMIHPSVDTRGTKGMALGFAVSTRGGDHLKGLPLYEVAPMFYIEDIKEEMGIDVGDGKGFWGTYENKPKFMIWHENWHCVVDSIGLCKLEGIAFKPLRPKHFVKLLTTATGWEIDKPGLEKCGERIWTIEKAFNLREGMGRKEDYPPSRLMNEPISTGPAKGDLIKQEDFDRMLTEYYSQRGWDNESGIPTRVKLQELGLENISEDLNAK